ncbi:MAG: class I SAM-dependent methyltransferase [Elusimicrobiota bacterium]
MTAPDLCAVCAGGALRFSFRRNGLEFRECRDCGCAFLAPASAAGVRYDAAYFDSLRSNSESCRRSNAREQVRLLARFASGRPGRLLDVGCGLAEFLAQAEEAGWRVSGCDLPRPPGEAPPDGRWENRIRRGAPETWRYDPGSFDAVTAFGVLEHAADPGELLRRMAGWLRPGGLLMLTTPSLTSWSARLMGRFWPHFHREHLTYFTERALRALLERHGFGGIRSYSWRRVVTLEFMLEQADRYFPDWTPGAVAGVLRRLPESARSFPLRLPSGSVGLVARAERAQGASKSAKTR